MSVARFRSLAVALTLAGMANLPLCDAATARQAFPYGSELRLEAKPMRGSKRVPWLQFAENGKVEIDLWCATGQGHAVVVDRTITIVPTALRNNQCAPEQLEADKAFLSKLMQVTAWRWDGHLLLLEGPEMLRWRPASN
ncbi:MAG: META domain-containing protein [Pseudorhodoplanes sp.]|uniref:META domain-containing protein n=1 Tax=Pseudorhodoplanes sp. TaxID=1934341 RepID=UPI003D0EF309